MNRNNFKKQVLLEQIFYNNFGEEIYGKYSYLIGHSITTFRYIDQWENEIFPYLESLRNKTGKINDWNSFPWRGEICFRFDYIMILDESIHQIGRKMPGLYDENGNQVINEEYHWLMDTEYVKNNYTEFVIIPLDDFVKFCKIWVAILKENKSENDNI